VEDIEPEPGDLPVKYHHTFRGEECGNIVCNCSLLLRRGLLFRFIKEECR